MSVETLRKQIHELEANIQELESDCEELEEKIHAKKAKKATIKAQVQASIFLERIFAPYLDGICQEWGVSPEEALRILIDDESTLGKIAKDRPEELAKLVNLPEVRVMIAVAKPLGNVSDDWIKNKTNVLLEVMKQIRPPLANAIINTPGGQEWFYKSLIGLRDIIYGIPKLNSVTA